MPTKINKRFPELMNKTELGEYLREIKRADTAEFLLTHHPQAPRPFIEFCTAKGTRKVLYSKRQIDAWLSGGYMPTTSESEQMADDILKNAGL